MKRVEFVAKEYDYAFKKQRDGGDGWIVRVDGKDVCEIDSDEMDVSDHALDALWKALDIKMIFDFD